MKALLEHADEIPVTLLLLIAYVTMAVLTGIAEPDGAKLEQFGWLTPQLAASGEPWRLATHALLHGGLLHLAFNGYMLISVGPALERSLGSVRFAVLYLVAALGGGIAVCLCYHELQPVVGGSGALFGMLGALVAMFAASGRHAFAFLAFEGPRGLLAMIAVNLLIGWWLPFVSNTAHVGGLVTGFVVTLLWLGPRRQRGPWLARWRAACAALFASLLFASVAPVWRWDYLFHRAEQATGAERRNLGVAVARSLGDPVPEDPSVEAIDSYLDSIRAVLAEVQQRRGG